MVCFSSPHLFGFADCCRCHGLHVSGGDVWVVWLSQTCFHSSRTSVFWYVVLSVGRQYRLTLSQLLRSVLLSCGTWVIYTIMLYAINGSLSWMNRILFDRSYISRYWSAWRLVLDWYGYVERTRSYWNSHRARSRMSSFFLLSFSWSRSVGERGRALSRRNYDEMRSI